MPFGILKPTIEIFRPFRTPLSIRRCEADGGLVCVANQASLSVHAGHRVKSPVQISLLELLLIWVGVIK